MAKGDKYLTREIRDLIIRRRHEGYTTTDIAREIFPISRYETLAKARSAVSSVAHYYGIAQDKPLGRGPEVAAQWKRAYEMGRAGELCDLIVKSRPIPDRLANAIITLILRDRDYWQDAA